MQRFIPALILLFIGALGGYLWKTYEVVEEPIEVGPAAAQDSGQRVTPERMAALPPAPASSQEKAAQPALIPEDMQLVSTLDIDESNGMKVAIVEQDDQPPFSKCVLHVVEGGALQNLKVREEMQRDMIGFIRDRGKHYAVPQDGRLFIKRPDGPVVLGAQTATGFAFKMVRTISDEAVVLTLQPILKIKALVRDDKGNPVAGARVALGVRVQRRNSSPELRELFLRETSEGGTVVFEAIHDLLAQVGKEGSPYVGLQCVTDPMVAVPFDINDPPQETVDLRMPPMGSISLQVLDPEGKQVNDTLGVVIDIDKETRKDSLSLGGGGRLTQAFDGGAVTIPHIGCNLKLDIVVESVIGKSFAPLRKSVNGPLAAGENVEVVLQFRESYPTITGRLLYPDRQPVKTQRVYAAWKTRVDGRPKMRGFHIQTDGDGRFSMPLRDRFSQDAEYRYLTFELAKTAERGPLTARHDLPVAAFSILSDAIPDITLEPVPFLVAGVVVDREGKPVPTARVRLVGAGETRREKRRFKTEFVDKLYSDEEGKFLARGTANRDEFAVSVQAAGYLKSEVMVRKGSRDVRVTLNRASFIKGTLDVTPPLALDSLRGEIIYLDDDARSRRFSLRPDASFISYRLEPGRYQVRISYRTGGGVLLWHSDTIELADGETHDMGKFKLPFDLVPVKLVLQSPGFEENKSALLVRALHSDSETVLAEYYMTKPSLDILLPVDGCDLSVLLENYRERIYRNVSKGTVDINLTRGYPVQFKLKSPGKLPGGTVLGVRLIKKREWHRAFLPGFGKIEKDTLFLEKAGRYELRAFLAGKQDRADLPDFSMPVEIRGSDAVQTIEFELDPEEINRAFAEIDE